MNEMTFTLTARHTCKSAFRRTGLTFHAAQLLRERLVFAGYRDVVIRRDVDEKAVEGIVTLACALAMVAIVAYVAWRAMFGN